MPEQVTKLDIYNTDDDKVAGFMSLIIDEYIKINGKISDSAAAILAKRIDRVPVFSIIEDPSKVDFNKKGHGLTAGKLGIDQSYLYAASAQEVAVKLITS